MAAADALLADAERVAKEAQRHISVSTIKRPAPQRSFISRVMREGVIMAALVAVIIAGVNLYLGQSTPDKALLTPKQLARFTGAGPPMHSKRIYVSILGSVFDVTSGAKHYGPGGNYNGAAGRDASKAFYSGNFTADQTDDLSAAKPGELASVYRWRNFFRDHKTYTPVGRLTGRFYTAAGQPTEELQRIEKVGAQAAAQAADSNKGNTECNVQWSKGGGKMLWCSEGKGLPRRIADADASSDRCVCVARPATPNAVLKPYDGCAPDAAKCVIPDLA
jgi:hypothetical protein